MPVEILIDNIRFEFEKAAERNAHSMAAAVEHGIVNREIDYILDLVKPCAPRVDLKTKTIQLQESYLAYLWAFTYSSLVIYEEGVQRPLLNGLPPGAIHFDRSLLVRARALGDWAVRFAAAYEVWDETLPSPRAQQTPEETSFALKTNYLFLRAVTFLLMHEYAHLYLRHCLAANDADQLAQEKEADNFALAFLIDNATDESERLKSGLAMVILTSSNLFMTPEFRGLWKRSHPHTQDRIRHALSGLNLESPKSKYYLYYFASINLRLFLQQKGISLPQLTEDTAEDLFFRYLDIYDTIRDQYA